MEIAKKLPNLKQYTVCVAAILLSLTAHQVMPSFLNVFSFFWPLFLSTALLLVTIVFFYQTSSQVAGRSARKTGEGSTRSSVAGEESGVFEFVAEQEEGGMFVFNNILGLAEESSGSQAGLPEQHKESAQ